MLGLCNFCSPDDGCPLNRWHQVQNLDASCPLRKCRSIFGLVWSCSKLWLGGLCSKDRTTCLLFGYLVCVDALRRDAAASSSISSPYGQAGTFGGAKLPILFPSISWRRLCSASSSGDWIHWWSETGMSKSQIPSLSNCIPAKVFAPWQVLAT